jgi:hypothetical protein
MLKTLVALVGALSLASTVAAQPRSQEELIATLRTGTPAERDAALDQVALIPPDQRGTALWLTLVNELQRLTKEDEAREDAVASGRELPAQGPLGGVPGYLRDLITVVGEWRDPRVIPALISAPGGGMIITEPIVRFGDVAVPSLIETARHGHASHFAGSMLALEMLMTGRTTPPYNIPPAALSPESRNGILRLAQDLLRPKATPWPHLPIVASLALTTGDPELRRQVELLAREPGVVSQVTGLIDAHSIDLIQHGIAARVKEHPQR